MTVLAVFGSLNMDLVLRVQRRPGPGETVFGESFDQFLGGKGFNQAVAARRLGADVRMLGTVGADAYGERFHAALAAEGIDTGGLVTHAEAGTGVAVPVIDSNGENSIICVPRANMRATPEQIEAATHLFDGLDALLLQLETPQDASLAAARLAHAQGARVLLNVAPAGPVDAGLLAASDVVIANEHEARALTGVDVTDALSARAAAARLAERTSATVVITLGAGGSAARHADDWLHVPAFGIEAVDTTGSGDTFCAAFAVQVVEGAPLPEALRWANAAGACAALVAGAEPSLPHRPVVEAMAAGERGRARASADGS